MPTNFTMRLKKSVCNDVALYVNDFHIFFAQFWKNRNRKKNCDLCVKKNALYYFHAKKGGTEYLKGTKLNLPVARLDKYWSEVKKAPLDESMFNMDGVHPNDQGHDVMADLLPRNDQLCIFIHSRQTALSSYHYFIAGRNR